MAILSKFFLFESEIQSLSEIKEALIIGSENKLLKDFIDWKKNLSKEQKTKIKTYFLEDHLLIKFCNSFSLT